MISKEEVKNIAEIAKLKFGEDELEAFTEKFSLVLDFVHNINKVDTEGIEPCYGISEENGFFKELEEEQTLDREEVLKNTTESEYGYFKILKVVE
ncbi:MAG: Asp-tRNA(Asn)/Glu-tRNA(Gln) amidotransferase subunit GatC [Tissierellales bacterium]|nr:Asp-tRNA(Asn)/Glu-tRNA(Gln) amidotransferase subunit GatC [Tissierellales bacterium]